MKDVAGMAVKLVLLLVFLSAAFVAVRCNYQAYRQRFPQAEPWTYLFKE